MTLGTRNPWTSPQTKNAERRPSSIKVKLIFCDGFPSPEFQYSKCSSNRFDDALQTLTSTKRKVLSFVRVSSMTPEFLWVIFCLLTCLPSKYEESSPKNSSKVFFSSSSPLSTIPFYVFLWQLCSTDTEWGILTQQSPAQSRCWLPCSLLNFLYFYLQEHPDRLCLEFWSTERIFSSLELSRPSCKGVLGFKPSQELNTTELLTYSLLPAGWRKNTWEGKCEKTHKLR